MTRESKKALQLSNVGVCYKKKAGLFKNSDFWAINNISFDVKQGETIGIIGKNGVGKSTLLKVITGIIKPDCGHVNTFGNSVSLLGLAVGFSQKLSGRENTIINALLQGVSKKYILSKIDEIEEFSGLTGFFDQPVNTYSDGMRTRLRFSIAIQVNPDILLIDEALGVGDEAFKRKSSKEIKDRALSGHTVIIVSHHPETLTDLCDKLVWIDSGIAKLSGKTEDVLEAYKCSSKNK